MSLRIILWGAWMSEQNFTAILTTVDEIFRSGAKWWLDQQMNQKKDFAIPGIMLLVWRKNTNYNRNKQQIFYSSSVSWKTFVTQTHNWPVTWRCQLPIAWSMAWRITSLNSFMKGINYKKVQMNWFEWFFHIYHYYWFILRLTPQQIALTLDTVI